MMQRNARVVTDKKVAAFLTKLDNLIYIQPFLGKGCSASEAAEQAQVKLNVMHYHIKKLLDLQVLEVIRIQKRAGRAIKYYRSVADEWFVKTSDTPFTNLEAFLEGASSALIAEQIYSQAKTLQNNNENLDYGFWIRSSEDGKDVIFRWLPQDAFAKDSFTAPEKSEIPIALGVGRIKLSKHRAEELRLKIAELFDDFAEDPEGDYHIFRFAFTKDLS